MYSPPQPPACRPAFVIAQVGFETEFVLLDPRTLGKGALPMMPIDSSNYCQSSAVDAYAHGGCCQHISVCACKHARGL
jgi:hypothetical protein